MIHFSTKLCSYYIYDHMDIPEWVLDSFLNTETIDFAKLKKKNDRSNNKRGIKIKDQGSVLAPKADKLDPGLWAIVV